MKKGIKICTIGGGSSYTPELIEGFIKRYDELPVAEIWLVDILDGKEKLDIITNLAKRMIKKSGLPIKVFSTLDRREALAGADFVTTQLRVGLLPARILDEKISLKYGIIGQETNGPGGMFKALRTVPVILDICKDMDELCPDAWLINFTNPVGIVSEAILKYTNMRKFIGLCNVPIDMENQVANFLNVNKSRLKIHFAGLNHMVFGIHIFLDGVNITQDLLYKLSISEHSMSVKNITNIPWDNDLVTELGVLLCPYHRYYLMKDKMLDDELAEKHTRGELVYDVEKELFELYSNENLDIKPKQLEERGGAYYSDAACNLIASIYNDKRDIQVVNTINNGAISNMPYDAIVEVSSVITKDGPIPLRIGALPDSVIGLVMSIKSFDLMTARAAVTGSYNTALMALTINPLVQSQKKARLIIDDMIEAHKKYLPLFIEEVSE